MRVDGSRAFGAGFRLFGREPLTVAGWVLFQLLISAISLGGVLWLFTANAKGLQAWGESLQASPESFLRLFAGFAGLGIVSIIVSLILQAVMLNAIYRAVLYPDGSRAFARLRLGGRELWMALHLFAYFVALFGGLGLALWGVAAATKQTWLAVLLGFLLPLPLVTLFTLSGPAVFQRGGFRLFSTFRDALANFGPLLLCNFLLCLVTIGVWILSLVVGLAQSVAFSGAMRPMQPGNFAEFAPMVTQMLTSPAYLVATAINTAISVLYLVVIVAPAARAYADIHGEAGGTAEVFS